MPLSLDDQDRFELAEQRARDAVVMKFYCDTAADHIEAGHPPAEVWRVVQKMPGVG